MAQGHLERDRADAAHDQGPDHRRPAAPGGRCPCLILGGASSVFDDYERARHLAGPHCVIAVNDVGAAFPGPLLAWCSLHPEKLGVWRGERTGPPAAHVIAPWAVAGAGVTTPLAERWGGSSGLYAVQAALRLFGFQHIVLCGIPMTGEAGHITGKTFWEHADVYQQGWLRARPHLTHRVRSMSGWTQDLLGSPPPDWLRGIDP